mmetsp:Transcript_26413/g.40892  ORF Transcript_26413/g.40892 Transcript_26413/m.40892 type:complete len:285 (-) Transcript_26413:132-986(-)|eukprot:CAMPEP_0196805662 /NCGR_PEP_ID=MMETSP1362-20130617/5458_1 /TAXON_ID=163516 /ORGANISM="Leptocylindrus danicus, Strain CCMP1856" /LENGTH=284 /DNA_ID=CAMNT_0042178719 /DNA_START=77 /DNA_END=931 /DNA_ORIENTATION=-
MKATTLSGCLTLLSVSAATANGFTISTTSTSNTVATSTSRRLHKDHLSNVHPSSIRRVTRAQTLLQERGGANDNPLIGGPEPGFIRRLLPFVAWHRVPDWLTYARCIAIPLLAVVFYNEKGYDHVASGVLFAFASFTDWLDGFLARRWEVTSSFGAFLDPVADKLMVSTALILLSGRYGQIVAIPTVIILAREIAVSALREWMAQRGQRDSVKVGFQGKVKTALTMLSLTLLLLVPYPMSGAADDVLAKLYEPSLAMLYACAVITVTSGSVYFKAAWPVLTEGR